MALKLTSYSRSLAANYNCWFEVLPLLEKRILTEKGREKEKVARAMASLLDTLGEQDLSFALKRNMVRADTRRALSLEMYGDLQKAVASYDALINLPDEAREETILNMEVDGVPVSRPDLGVGGLNQVGEGEIALWEERWVELNRQLGQWAPVLKEYSEATGNADLEMECAWKTRDWEGVRKLCSSPSVVAALESGDPRVKLYEIYLSIADGKLGDVEKLCAQCVQLSLHAWQSLPTLATGGEAHGDLLRLFHRLVELRESGQIMIEVSNHTKFRTFPDLKNILQTWRERQPNDWDSLNVYDDIYVWRSHMFAAIQSNFHYSDPSNLAALHDRPWSVIKMSRIARKHGIPEVSLASLSKLYTTNTMDVQDAYAKLREQIVTCLAGDDGLQRGGLNIINNTNLDYFSGDQRSELFRLKAKFVTNFGDLNESNRLFAQATMISPTYARTWESWGDHVYSLAQTQGPADSTKFSAQAIGSYLEAVRLGWDKSRLKLPLILKLVKSDGDEPGLLSKTLEERGDSVPAWVWLPHIHALLRGLGGVEASACKKILETLVIKFPQAVYWQLRGFYLERRDAEGGGGEVGEEKDGGENSAELAGALLVSLRKAHPKLFANLETIVEELMNKCRQSMEEQLLNAVVGLSERCAEVNGTAVPEAMQTAFGLVFEQFFPEPIEKKPAPATKKGKAKKAKKGEKKESEEKIEEDKMRVDEQKKFSGVYKKLFKDHFVHGKKTSLVEVKSKLDMWTTSLRATVAKTPRQVVLSELSPALAAYTSQPVSLWPTVEETVGEGKEGAAAGGSTPKSNSSAAALAAQKAAVIAHDASSHVIDDAFAVEIPGQYLDSKPSPELQTRLLKFDPTVTVVERGTGLVRRVGWEGSDGITHYWTIHASTPDAINSEVGGAELINFENRLLGTDLNALKRHLKFLPRVVAPLSQRVSIMKEKLMANSLGDVDNDLGLWVRTTLVSPEALFTWRKNLARSLAALVLQNHVMAVAPSAMVCDTDGVLSSAAFQPNYSLAGLLEGAEIKVKGGVKEVLSGLMIQGVTIPALATMATALDKSKDVMAPELELFLAENLNDWHGSKSGAKSDVERRELSKTLSTRVESNVALVSERIKALALQDVGAGEVDKAAGAFVNSLFE